MNKRRWGFSLFPSSFIRWITRVFFLLLSLLFSALYETLKAEDRYTQWSFHRSTRQWTHHLFLLSVLWALLLFLFLLNFSFIIRELVKIKMLKFKIHHNVIISIPFYKHNERKNVFLHEKIFFREFLVLNANCVHSLQLDWIFSSINFAHE